MALADRRNSRSAPCAGEQIADIDLPDIGEVEEGKTIYSTSIAEVLGEPDDEGTESVIMPMDDDLNELWAAGAVLR